ncbi:uvrD_C_2 domain-containing protein [Trichonephila clavipes]|nr:uvrD_C_2 domain-containing protein [Trichonephila clavipes]
MITNFFIPELNNHYVQELWFQQDGATCHTARATIDLLKDTFGDHLISRFRPVNWPPRSCDFTPLDYFLWGYVKSLVYADKPQTRDHLEDNIRRVIADIRPQMLEKVIENWTSRLDYIRASRGSHMPEIIFKIDENGDIIRIWLKFPKSCGRKQATKLRNLSARLNLDDDAVPITSQTSSVALNNNKTIIAKRKHFPLVSALAMTIHKSQGGTYDAIVYEYDRKHPRELVYVALSRVTKIEGLFMVTKENTEDSWKFWIGRSGIPLNASESDKHLKRSTSHREDLTLELKN